MIVSADSLYYKAGPDCIILVHGYIGSIQEVRRTARALNKASYSVFAFNLAGHGTDEVGDIFRINPNQWIEQVREAVNFIEAEGYQSISIVGISLGGILAINESIQRPNFFHTIGAFNSPIIDGLQPTPIKNYTIKALRRILNHRKWSEEAIEEKIQETNDIMDQQIKQIDDFIENVRNKLDTIEGRVYIAKSEEDELIDPESQDELARRLTKADIELDSFENCRHVITTGPDFRVFQDHLIEYMNSIH